MGGGGLVGAMGGEALGGTNVDALRVRDIGGARHKRGEHELGAHVEAMRSQEACTDTDGERVEIAEVAGGPKDSRVDESGKLGRCLECELYRDADEFLVVVRRTLGDADSDHGCGLDRDGGANVLETDAHIDCGE